MFYSAFFPKNKQERQNVRCVIKIYWSFGMKTNTIFFKESRTEVHAYCSTFARTFVGVPLKAPCTHFTITIAMIADTAH